MHAWPYHDATRIKRTYDDTLPIHMRKCIIDKQHGDSELDNILVLAEDLSKACDTEHINQRLSIFRRYGASAAMFRQHGNVYRELLRIFPLNGTWGKKGG